MADIVLEYRVYRDSDAGHVTDLLADVFSRHDPLAHAAQVTRAEFAGFALSLLPQAAKDGLTIVACMPATGEIVGVMLTNDGAADSPAELSESNQKFRPIASILGELDEIYLAGRQPRLGEMLHLYLLGVSDRVAGHGIGQQLVLRTVEHGASKVTKSRLLNRLTGDRNTSSGSLDFPSEHRFSMASTFLKGKTSSQL